MDASNLVAKGNILRDQNDFEGATAAYAEACIKDPDCYSAFNNYGNLLRETLRPRQAIPFLQAACTMQFAEAHAPFNLAVAYLSIEDYPNGWKYYESRWDYEHMQGMLPKLEAPRWNGEDLRGKTIFVCGEQGFGDIIQMSRFFQNLYDLGARVKLTVEPNIIPLFEGSAVLESITRPDVHPGHFDYWTMLMDLPGRLGITRETLPAPLQYIGARQDKIAAWQQRLGPKTRMRIGFAYSGRRDSWINQHKSMPLTTMMQLIKQCPEADWISLQVDADENDTALLRQEGLPLYPGSISDWTDTAGLVHNLDLVVSVDTAVAHLAAAMGKPVWVPLNRYAPCWRWGVDKDTMPWYPTIRIFRQAVHGQWDEPLNRIARFIRTFKP